MFNVNVNVNTATPINGDNGEEITMSALLISNTWPRFN